jgi:sarcosine oxidase subunit alpha
MNKPFFVGQRSLRVLQRRPLRQQLVGFTLAGGEGKRPKEAHLVIDAGRIAGRVTSVLYSPTLGRVIGLALVDPAIAQRKELRIRIDRGEELMATVASLPFYDKPGDRQTLDENGSQRAEKIA